jgi:hypothetical protein
MVGRKVVGDMEGLNYIDDIWKAMSKEQEAKVTEVQNAWREEHAVKAASSDDTGPVLMDFWCHWNCPGGHFESATDVSMCSTVF